ncbi:MAG TPA: radical SAM protein, partial [Thermodesulfobacteriota bacterium]|nr:radical SAM protein [Thermodesulfobacteriota bacterium]
LFRAYAPLGWARRPNHVSLDVTRRCNLRCEMCFYYGGEPRAAAGLKELSAEEIISRVVDRLSDVDYDLTGGEPLVRPDLPDILLAIRRRKGRAAVTTNGTLMTPELARRIVGEDLLTAIHFSLHGVKETHEKVTRVKGSFDRALKGLECVVKERTRTGQPRPQVTIACTITGNNMTEAEKLVALGEEIGADRISFGHASFMPPGSGEKHRAVMEELGLEVRPEYDDLVQGPPGIPFQKDDLETYIKTISRLRKDKGEQKIGTSPAGYGGPEIRSHYLDPNWAFRDSCFYPWRNLRVGPDGAVTPCVGYPVGNVRDADVRDLWNHARFRFFRAALYKRKLFPGCVRCCKLK